MKQIQGQFRSKGKQLVQLSDRDYGPDANPDPDFPNELLEKEKTDFLVNLRKTAKEIQEIEEKTRGQNKNAMWLQERHFRLTSAKFAK